MASIVNYVQESVRELELVRWPTRQQAIRLSVIVIGFTAINAVIFGVIDMGLSKLLGFLLSSTI